jgi:arginine/lysine/ornithine decarboxylase
VPVNRVFHKASGLLQGAFQLDYTTAHILGSLFDRDSDKPLHHLKRRLASAYGAYWSFPSTNGTTILNILALLSACPIGGRVLVNRDAHSSVTAALIHGGFEPVYLTPEYDVELGLSTGPALGRFDELLSRERIDCVFLTSPNYFGIVGDIAAIIERAHARAIPVVVDAAHAPHFHFCAALPVGAEDLGADLVAQSTHKVATALSQGSLLLLNNPVFTDALYEHVNDLGFVSTSFSYPILASLELGVQQLVEEGEEIWSQTVERAERFRRDLNDLSTITCFGRERVSSPGFHDLDLTRITVDVSGTGLTGFDVERQLNREWIYPEMATLRHLLFLLTPGTTEGDLERLFASLARIDRAGYTRSPRSFPLPPPVPPMAVIPRTAKYSQKRAVSLRDAVGRVSGETISAYPPGAPVIAAGETVSLEAIEYLRCLKHSGAALRGAADEHFETLRVLSS